MKCTGSARRGDSDTHLRIDVLTQTGHRIVSVHVFI